MALKRKLLVLVTWMPALLWAIPALTLWLFFGRRLRMANHAWTFELKPTSWPMRSWYRGWGGTTFGYVIMTYPEPDAALFRHEFVHVEQFESACLWGWFLALLLAQLGHPWIGTAVWLLASKIQYIAAGIVAWLRGERFYFGNHLEEAAYATALREDSKESCRSRDA